MRIKKKILRASNNECPKFENDILDQLPHDKNLKVLDLGCGNGDFTAKLHEIYPNVVGYDSSLELIEQARKNHSNVVFEIVDAFKLKDVEKWDIIFVSPIFYLLTIPRCFYNLVYKALKPNGIMVTCLGDENFLRFLNAYFLATAKKMGHQIPNKFRFPSPSLFQNNLKRSNFEIMKFDEISQDCYVDGGNDGLKLWIKKWYSSYLYDFTPFEKEELLLAVIKRCTKEHFDGSEWHFCYRKLRVIALKPSI